MSIYPIYRSIKVRKKPLCEMKCLKSHKKSIILIPAGGIAKVWRRSLVVVGIGRWWPWSRLHGVGRQRRPGVSITMVSSSSIGDSSILIPARAGRRASEVSSTSHISPGGSLADISPSRGRPVDGRVHGFDWINRRIESLGVVSLRLTWFWDE